MNQPVQIGNQRGLFGRRIGFLSGSLTWLSRNFTFGLRNGRLAFSHWSGSSSRSQSRCYNFGRRCERFQKAISGGCSGGFALTNSTMRLMFSENGRGGQVEKLRARDTDVDSGLVDLEKLQAMERKLFAQGSGQLQREMHLIIPLGAQCEALQLAITQVAAFHAVHDQGFDRFDDRFRFLVGGAGNVFRLLPSRRA